LPCDQEKPPTCTNLVYSINGYTQISDCSRLQSENNEKTNTHTFLCNNMINIFVSDNCLNLTNYPTDCYANVGNRINSIYKQNQLICRNIDTFFNFSNNTQSDNIRNTCNKVQFVEPWYSSVVLVMLVMGASAIGLCCFCACCCNVCRNIKETISGWSYKSRTVFRSVTSSNT
jgi:hypothetical protein